MSGKTHPPQPKSVRPSVRSTRRRSAPAVIDLFAGAGGSALGARLAGADLRLSVEIDPAACRSLQTNSKLHGGRVHQADVSSLSGDQLRALASVSHSQPVIIIGGPPCQPFSKAAYWTDPGDDSRYRRARAAGKVHTKPEPITTPKDDVRRSLLEEFARLIIEARADAFMFENVPSLLHPRNRATFSAFRAILDDAGYSTVMATANAAEFGVAQMRQRVVMLGIKDGEVSLPLPTHRLKGTKGSLPTAVAAGPCIREFRARRFAEPEEVVSGRWFSELAQVPPGMNYKALSSWAGHANPVFVAETRFWSFLLKLDPKRPSWTIAANPGPWVGPFHWSSRRLRTVEMAALQSFPADYQFVGTRREKVRQIGNAMPPLLASAMVGSLLQAVERR